VRQGCFRTRLDDPAAETHRPDPTPGPTRPPDALYGGASLKPHGVCFRGDRIDMAQAVGAADSPSSRGSRRFRAPPGAVVSRLTKAFAGRGAREPRGVP